MILSRQRTESLGRTGRLSRGVPRFLCLLAVGVAWPAFAGDGAVAFDAVAARELPQAIYDKITSRITRQTTFVQVGPEGHVRWSPRTLQLVDFVKAPSPTYQDTYLIAMRYVVSVGMETSFVMHETSCQAVVVYKQKEWSEPTVVCAPLNLGQPEPS